MTDDPLFQQPDAVFQPGESVAEQALERESRLPLTGWQQEVDQGLQFGLEAAESIRDRTIPTFSRGELPHYAGINTFLKAPYLEVSAKSATTTSLLSAFPTTPAPPIDPAPASVPKVYDVYQRCIRHTILNWASISESKLLSAMLGISLPSLRTTKSLSIRFLRALLTSLVLARSQSFWGATTPLASPPFEAFAVT